MSSGASLPSNPTPAYQFQSQPQADKSAMGGINTLASNVANTNAQYNSGASTAAVAPVLESCTSTP